MSDEIDDFDDQFEDDFDIDEEGLSNSVQDDRNPVTSTLKNVSEGFMDSFKDTDKTEQVKQVLGSTFKGFMGSRISGEVNDAYGFAESEISTGISDIKKTARPLVKTLKKALPEDSAVGKMFSKLSTYLGDDRRVGSESETEKVSRESNELILNAFGERANSEQRERLVKASMDKLADDNRDSILRRVSSLLRGNLDFLYNNSDVYYRKSLELQYKHLFEARKLNALTGKAFDTFKNQFESINKNTALPDFVKIRSTEAIKQQFRTEAGGELYNTLIRNNTWIEDFKDNLKDKISGTVEGIKTGLTVGNEVLDPMISAKEDIEEMGGKDAIANMGGEMAGEASRSYFGEFLGRLAGRSEFFAKAKEGVDSFFIDPGQSLNKLSKNYTDDDWRGKILSGGADMMSATGKYRDVELGREDLNDASYLDNRTKSSITKVIPGLLSKILKEVSSIRNKEEVEELNFNFDKDIFETKESFSNTFKEEVKYASEKTGALDSLENTVNALARTSNVELTEEESIKLAMALLRYSKTGKELHTDYLDEEGFFDQFDSMEALKFRSIFANIGKNAEGKTDFNTKYEVNKAIRSIKNIKVDSTKRIDEDIKAGNTEELVKLGLLKYNEKDHKYVLDHERYDEYLSESLEENLFKERVPEEVIKTTKDEVRDKVTGVVSGIRNKFAGKVDDTLVKAADVGFDLYDFAKSGDKKVTFDKKVDETKDKAKETYDNVKERIDPAAEYVKTKLTPATEFFQKYFKGITRDRVASTLSEKLNLSVDEEVFLRGYIDGINGKPIEDIVTIIFNAYKSGDFQGILEEYKTKISMSDLDEYKNKALEELEVNKSKLVEKYENIDVGDIKDKITNMDTKEELQNILETLSTAVDPKQESDDEKEEQEEEKQESLLYKFKSLFSSKDKKNKSKTIFEAQMQQQEETNVKLNKLLDILKKDNVAFDKDDSGRRDGSYLDKLDFFNKKKEEPKEDKKTTKVEKEKSGFDFMKLFGMLGALTAIPIGIAKTLSSIALGVGGLTKGIIGGLGKMLLSPMVSLLKLPMTMFSMAGVIGKTILKMSGLGALTKFLAGKFGFKGKGVKVPKALASKGVFGSVMNLLKRNPKTAALATMFGLALTNLDASDELENPDILKDLENENVSSSRETLQQYLLDNNASDNTGDIENYNTPTTPELLDNRTEMTEDKQNKEQTSALETSANVALTGVMYGGIGITKKAIVDTKRKRAINKTRVLKNKTPLKTGIELAKENVRKKLRIPLKPRLNSKATARVLEETAKTALKATSKKAFLKTGVSLLRKVPIIGLLLGGATAVSRAWEGDYEGAGIAATQGLMSTLLPGVGGLVGVTALEVYNETRDRGNELPEKANVKIDLDPETQEPVVVEKDDPTPEAKKTEEKPDLKHMDELQNSLDNYIARTTVMSEEALEEVEQPPQPSLYVNPKIDTKPVIETDIAVQMVEKKLGKKTKKELTGKDTYSLPKSHINDGDKILLDGISKGEGTNRGNAYNVVFGYKKWVPKDMKDLETMTLTEVRELQRYMLGKQRGLSRLASTAVGKYQFISVTFEEIVKALKLPDNTLFNKDTQDTMILYRLVRTRKYLDWKTNKIDDNEFIFNLSQEFASIATTRDGTRKGGKKYTTGESYYGQPVGNTLKDMYALLANVRKSLNMPESTSKEVGYDTSDEPKEEKKTSVLASGLKSALKTLFDFLGIDIKEGSGLSSKPELGDETEVVESEDNRVTRPSSPSLPTSPTSTSNVGLCGIDFNHVISRTAHEACNNGKIVPKYLVIHNTAGSSLWLDGFKNKGVGTALWISKDGTITLVNELDNQTWHVGGVANLKGGVNQPVRNQNSIGIEMVCAYNKQTKKWDSYTKAQRASLRKVAACVIQKYGIDKSHVVYHEEVAKKTKDEGKEGRDLILGISATELAEVKVGKTGSAITVDDASVTPLQDVASLKQNKELDDGTKVEKTEKKKSFSLTGNVKTNTIDEKTEVKTGDNKSEIGNLTVSSPTPTPHGIMKVKVPDNSTEILMIDKLLEESKLSIKVLTSIDKTLISSLDIHKQTLEVIDNLKQNNQEPTKESKTFTRKVQNEAHSVSLDRAIITSK